MAEQPETTPKPSVKHDWYQTDAAVVITVLIKNVIQESVDITFLSDSVKVKVINKHELHYDKEFQLSHPIVPEGCSYKLTPSKIEIKLKKLDGIRWDALEGSHTDVAIKTIPQAVAAASSKPPSYPTSKPGRNWSEIEKDIKEQEAKEKGEGDEALNKLFQEIYGKGDENVKRAMNKSFLESGGTVLSTNWNEISKEKVPVKPPDGMEWKKWDS